VFLRNSLEGADVAHCFARMFFCFSFGFSFMKSLP